MRVSSFSKRRLFEAGDLFRPEVGVDGLEDEVSKMASYAEQMWYVEPLGGSIGSYDKENDKP